MPPVFFSWKSPAEERAVGDGAFRFLSSFAFASSPYLPIDRAKVTLRRILVRFIPLARTPYPFKPVSERAYYAAFSTRKGNDERGIKSQPASANFARTAGEWNCGSTSALARGLHLGATLWVSDADPVVLCVLSFPTKVMPIQRVWPDAVQPTN